MQNRYVGDVGDFAKYGLLRHLMKDSELRLGIVWCLFDDETHNADGRHISYLKRPEYRILDATLHSKLSRIVTSGSRTVDRIAKNQILPRQTLYYDMLLCGASLDRKTRELSRINWVSAALDKTKSCQLVFFDPDNGLETASVSRHDGKGGKYIFWDELSKFWVRGQSLLIYHHLNRTASVAKQTETVRNKFAVRFPDAAAISYFLFRRGSCRHFWLVVNKAHSGWLAERTEALCQSPWREYFEVG
jgi:hypothetical protein